ncbi:MAG TPA: sigma-70 family RNA polymerase sigma factor [Polyangiaceae bacterium]|nr:sigma-70 family RNA polymerase sigma factor [Polyangiaceae bacterium]
MDAARRNAIHAAMVRLSDGDRAAMEELVRELWPVLLSFAARGLRDASAAEDVAQEVFVKICRKISDFDASRDGLSWAFGIASYEIMTQRRLRQRRRETAADHELDARSDAAPNQEEAALEAELFAVLATTTGALSEDDRRSLGLVSGRDEYRVASATLRKRRQRALERLRAAWRTLYGRP